MLKEMMKKEHQSGYAGVLFGIIFSFVFSTMFTPFIGIPVAIASGLLIHFSGEQDD